MPKKKRHCEHTYYEYSVGLPGLIEKPCPHPYFGAGIHPDTGEKINCCIFHASIETKWDHLDEFWDKFEGLFAKAEQDVKNAETAGDEKEVWLECYGFVFSDTTNVLRKDLRRRYFAERQGQYVLIDTSGCFTNREFPFSVNMKTATFPSAADFRDAKFAGNADFRDVYFPVDTFFSGAQFSGDAFFGNARFSSDAYFESAQFDSEANFRSAKFGRNALFEDVQFLGVTDFGETGFSGSANFRNVKFYRVVYFYLAKFLSYTDFCFARVYQNGILSFNETEFEGPSDFRFIRVHEPGEVRLRYAYFHYPKRVRLGETDVSRCSFSGTNIEEINFIRPEWPIRTDRTKRKYIYDEIIAEDPESGVKFSDAGEVYRRLRLNYESKLAYEAAGDFHVGQMECRLKDPNRKPWDKALTLAYKLVSGYGESVGRPLLWLLGLFALFTGLFLITGFPAADGSVVDWVWGVKGMFSAEWWGKLWLSIVITTTGLPTPEGFTFDWAWGFKGFLSREWWGQLWDGISFTLRSSVSFAVPGYAENVNAKIGATLPALMFFWKVFAVIIATLFILALRRRFRR